MTAPQRERVRQIFSTWLKFSSTGVSRPKIDTRTLTLRCSALTSLMEAGSVANGPSMTVTDSPTSKSTSMTAVAAAAAASTVSAAALVADCFLAAAGGARLPRQTRRPPRAGPALAVSFGLYGPLRQTAPPRPHRAPGVIGVVHADQDVTRELVALDQLLLAVLDLGDLFGGHLDLEDVIADVKVLHAGLEVGLHLVLVTGVAVDDVPVAGGAAQLLAQLLDRIDLGGLLHGRFTGGHFGGRRLVVRSLGGRYLIGCGVVGHVGIDLIGFGNVDVSSVHRIGVRGQHLGRFDLVLGGAHCSPRSSFTCWSSAAALPARSHRMRHIRCGVVRRERPGDQPNSQRTPLPKARSIPAMKAVMSTTNTSTTIG